MLVPVLGVLVAGHMRAERQPFVRTVLTRNPAYLLWVVAALATLGLGAAVPFFRERLHLAPLPAETWAVAIAAGLLAPAWWELWKWRARSAQGPSFTEAATPMAEHLASIWEAVTRRRPAPAAALKG